MARKEAQEKELKTILQKDIVTKNPILTADHVTELFWLFNHYADPRQKRADVRDLLLTAKTLGLDTKYQFVAKMLEDIHEATEGNALDFEQFLKEITNKIVRVC